MSSKANHKRMKPKAKEKTNDASTTFANKSDILFGTGLLREEVEHFGRRFRVSRRSDVAMLVLMRMRGTMVMQRQLRLVLGNARELTTDAHCLGFVCIRSEP